VSDAAQQEMVLSSPAFVDGGMMPRAHTCDGENLSPALHWQGVPDGTRSLVLMMEDLDIPTPRLRLFRWTHWLVYDIAPGSSLPEGIPREWQLEGGAKQGLTSFRRSGYDGPCPLGGAHRYRFHLYALDCTLDLAPEHIRRRDVTHEMEGHVLAHADLTGVYRRQKRERHSIGTGLRGAEHGTRDGIL